jgi:hypothetical protein
MKTCWGEESEVEHNNLKGFTFQLSSFAVTREVRDLTLPFIKIFKSQANSA